MSNNSYKMPWLHPQRVEWLQSTFISFGSGGFTRSQKVLFVALIILAIFMIVLLIKQHRKQAAFLKSQNEPVFLPIKNDKPHNGSKEVEIPNKKVSHQASPQFSYSFWCFINTRKTHRIRKTWANYKYGDWKCILYKGGPLTDGVSKDQAPGFWLFPKINKLWVVVKTKNGPENGEGIVYDDLPLDEWVNITLVVLDQSMDLYLNGKLERSIALKGNVVINKSKLNICPNGGFPGEIAYVQYYNTSLTPQKVYEIYEEYKFFMNNDIEALNRYLDFDPDKCPPGTILRDELDNSTSTSTSM